MTLLRMLLTMVLAMGAAAVAGAMPTDAAWPKALAADESQSEAPTGDDGAKASDAPRKDEPEAPRYSELVAVIETSRGTIKARLAPNQVPKLVAHFVNLANRGFYDGLQFHSVAAATQIHSGDPSGTGDGGCGYDLAPAFHKELLWGTAGVLGLWPDGRQVSSQFVITLVPQARKYNLTVPGIGRVVEGLDVAGKIRKGDKILTLRIEGDPSLLLSDFAEDVRRWNEVLDREQERRRTPAVPPGGVSG